MIEVDLEQGTQKWKDWRNDHIGSADSAVILGVSPYKTRAELWKEKQGLSSGQIKTASMQRGNDLEPMIRDQMSALCGCQFVTKVFVNEERPWQSASIDGYAKNEDGQEIIIEIKCANRKDHEQAKNHIVPKKYYPQLMHILSVTGLNNIRYCSYFDGDLVQFAVGRDYDFIVNLNYEEEEFWKSLQSFQKPEIDEIHKEFTKEPYMQRNDYEWQQLASRWISLQETKKLLLQEEKSIRDFLVSLSGDANAQGCGLKVSKRERKGLIDYSAIMECHNITIDDSELDSYRKQSTSYWVVEESM